MATGFDDVRAPLLVLRIRSRATVALGDLDMARAAAVELYADEVNRGAQAVAYALKVEAEIALGEYKPAEALEALDKLKRQGVPTGGLFDITYRETRARARASSRAGGRTRPRTRNCPRGR